MRDLLERWKLIESDHYGTEPTGRGFAVFGFLGFWAILIFALGMGIVFGIIECQGIEAGTGLSATYSIRAGCFIEHGGAMIPLERWIFLTGGTP